MDLILRRHHTNKQPDDNGSPFKARRADMIVARGYHPGAGYAPQTKGAHSGHH
ncbi:hypothetical protein [Prolixibacter sp. NT017]|uniref:hypothetical protein n=1 Tax=Prolixibacter sp. NT017 TaxID=2652390 RepID=UPI00129928B5|nr:hypothetical protein [Prolixibacter sp. NT017]